MKWKTFTAETWTEFHTKLKNSLLNKVNKTQEYYGDMNALVTSGFYRVGTNANLAPNCQYGQVIVSRGSDTCTQICGSYFTGKIYTRGCNSPDSNPNWTEWVAYSTSDDLDILYEDCSFDLSYSEENESLNIISGYGGHTSQWNWADTKTGNTGIIYLPTPFNELHIVIGIDNYMYTFNILADYLTDTPTLFRNGYTLSGSVYGDVYISVTSDKIEGWTVRKEGVIQNATVKVYYK